MRNKRNREREQADEVSHKLSCSQPGRQARWLQCQHIYRRQNSRDGVMCYQQKSRKSFRCFKDHKMTLAVLMLEIRLDKKKIRYIIAANRSQGPETEQRGELIYQKHNAYPHLYRRVTGVC